MSDATRLTSLEELDRWIELSHQRPVWIFKHSTRCGISASALEEFEGFAGEEGAEPVDWALIDVLSARQVSDELARRTGVRHETPQAFLLRDGEVVWHDSHWRIRADGLRRTAGTAA